MCSVVSNSLQPHGLHSLPEPSVHGIFQARILKWVAISYSRGSSQPRDQSCVSYISCIGRWNVYHWATWVVLSGIILTSVYKLLCYSLVLCFWANYVLFLCLHLYQKLLWGFHEIRIWIDTYPGTRKLNIFNKCCLSLYQTSSCLKREKAYSFWSGSIQIVELLFLK